MKRLVCLLVALCLTATLFSCTDNPKTKQEEAKTPEVTETQIEPTTPSEITTPDEITTLDETATPNEQEITTPDTPETVTPTEPEVVEPETTEPESEEPEENVVMLPEADENTKYITIEFPEDFPEEPYVEPNLVSPEEFEWGEYSLFVRVENTVYGEIGKPTYTYAFLGESCDTLEKGENIYNNIDRQYKQMYDFEFEESKTLDGVPISKQLPGILPTITESKVIYISEDASTIGNYHLVESGTHPNGNTIWNGILEIYQNGILTKTLTQNIDELGYGDYASGNFLYVYNGAFAVAPINEPIELYEYRLKIHNDSETLLYEYHYYDDYDHVVMIHDENSLNYVVEFADEMSLFDINQFIDERYLVFTIYGKDTHNVYMLDLEISEMTHLMNYCFNPILSPDMKYLAYTSYSMYHLGVNTHVKDDVDLPGGFYVKNLETGSTTFYKVALDEYMTRKEHQTLGWVNTKALLSK